MRLILAPNNRNRTEGPNMLILHRREWNRLKKQAGPPEKPAQQENEYLKALIEKSQGWMKTWPDTVKGCVALVEIQKEKQRAKQIATVKEYAKKKVNNNTPEAIEKAKQKIFDASCYGFKLVSALRESKTLEERDAQIEFQKEIKENEAEVDKKQRKTVTFCTFDLDKNSTAVEDQHKCRTIQNSKENKEMFKKQQEEKAKAKEQEKLSDLEDTQLMKYLLDREQEAEDLIKLLERQAIEQCGDEYRKTKEERAKWEAEYYAKIDKCRKEQEELNCQIKKVHQLINNRTQDSALMKSNYETVKKCQEEEKERYDNFIGKICKKGERRAANVERRTKEKEIQDHNKRMSIAEINKTLAEYVRQMECSNKCFCDRQCLITNCAKERNVKKIMDEIEAEYKEVHPPNFGPCNKLVAALKRREKEPTPWPDASASHELFVKNADETLRDCKYKLPARKVVDEYRKYNALDHTTLPVLNY